METIFRKNKKPNFPLYLITNVSVVCHLPKPVGLAFYFCYCIILFIIYLYLLFLVAIDLIVQHISDYLKRNPAQKPITAIDYGLSSSVPGSPQRAAKGGRPH